MIKIISAAALRAKYRAVDDMYVAGELTAQQMTREYARLNAAYRDDDAILAEPLEPAAEPAVDAVNAPASIVAESPSHSPATARTVATAAPVPAGSIAIPTILGRAPVFRLDGADDEQTEWSYAAMKGVTLDYYGPTLGLRDAHVFFALLELAAAHLAGHTIITTRSAVLKAAGLATGSASYTALERSLLRLARANMTVRSVKRWWSASLLQSPDCSDGAMTYKLDPKIIDAYYTGSWSSAKMPVFRAVNPGLASRMYMLLSQYPIKFEHSVSGVMRMVGTSSPSVAEFSKLLRAALPKLQKEGVISSWKVKRGELTVMR